MNRRRSAGGLSPLLLTGFACLAGAAWAQAPAQTAAIDPFGAVRGVPQISDPSGGLSVPQISRGQPLGATSQIPRRPAAPTPPQLNTEQGLRAATQLNRSGRTAEAASPLSTPAQGRPRAAAPIGGADRCDPRVPAARRTPECARVLETRSAEFERPEPTPLSPEQRLLAERRAPTEESVDARTVARRAATGAVGGDLAGQALAVAANAANRARREEEEGNNPGNAEADAVGAALLDLIGAGGNGGGLVVTPPPPR